MINIYEKLPSVKVGKLPHDPQFSKHIPNFKEIIKISKRYEKFKNVVVIGNGGSINSFRAFSRALRPKRNVYFIDTMEPEFLEDVSKKCNPEDTVVIPISKSGDTVGVLEELLYFINKKFTNIVSVAGGGALLEISKRMKWNIVKHPDIEGRFAGLSSCGLFPAAVCGIDVKKIYNGAKKIYKSEKIKRSLYKFSKSLFLLEENGYNEIFMPIYSEFMDGFAKIITQLIHETTGKNEVGQTIISAIAPESQHHTNQRFFGGPKNMIGIFIVIKNHKGIKIKVPKNISDVKLREGSISILNGLNLSNAINYESEGVVKTSSEEKIPYAVIELDKLSEDNVGKLMAMWQYIAYYSAILREQNPFDQPEVERSKEITFELIKNRK